MRPTSRLPIATAAVAAVLALVALPRASDAAASCGATTFVAGLGHVCPVEGGYLVPLPGGGTVFTHGHDPVPASIAPGPIPVAATTTPACVTDPLTEYHGLLVYARSPDRPDRSAALAPELRAMAGWANDTLRREAAEFGRALDYRMLCRGGVLAIDSVLLSTPHNQTTFTSIVADMMKLGYTSTMAKYWIFYDGHPPGTPGGTGTITGDDTRGVRNGNNFGPGWGVTWGYTGYWGGFIMMHENGHNLGAVQDSSPNTSGAGHCNDGQDVMCYDDGGPRSDYKSWICRSQHFDCNHDDYFHPDPPAGSYLSQRWNLGSPVNHFLQGCLYRTLRALPEQTISVPVPEACGGVPYSLSGQTATLPVAPNGTWGTMAAFVTGADASVCWRAADGALLGCDDDVIGPREGRVPAGAATADVTLRSDAPATLILSAV